MSEKKGLEHEIAVLEGAWLQADVERFAWEKKVNKIQEMLDARREKLRRLEK